MSQLVPTQVSQQKTKSVSPIPPRRQKKPISAIIAAQFADYKNSSLHQMKKSVQPKAVFISIVNLWRDWTKLPFDILAESILILHCDRRWLYSSGEDMKQWLQIMSSQPCAVESHRILSFLYQRSTDRMFKAFQSMILQKEKQNLLCWVSPCKVAMELKAMESKSGDSADCHPQWKKISDFISNLIIVDPVRHTSYFPLNLDQQWWDKKFQSEMEIATKGKVDATNCRLFTQLEFCGNSNTIAKELKYLEFRYKPMMEILHQSNPTMIPLMAWDKHVWDIKVNQIVQFQDSLIAMGNKKKWDSVHPQSKSNSLEYNIDALISKKKIESLSVPTVVTNAGSDFFFVQN